MISGVTPSLRDCCQAEKLKHNLLHKLQDVIDEVKAKIVVCYGSSITGKKRGILKKHDIDLIIVSDFFRSMSKAKREEVVRRRLSNRYDLILLTCEEYTTLEKEKESIVNVALSEGKVLFDDRKKRCKRN